MSEKPVEVAYLFQTRCIRCPHLGNSADVISYQCSFSRGYSLQARPFLGQTCERISAQCEKTSGSDRVIEPSRSVNIGYLSRAQYSVVEDAVCDYVIHKRYTRAEVDYCSGLTVRTCRS